MHIDGSPWNGATRKFYKAAGTTVTDDMFPGDPVVLSGSGDAAGIPSVVVATAGAGNQICGVVTSIVPLATHLDRVYLDGADAGYVNVCCDPDVIYEGQADASLTYTDIGNNTNIVATSAGDTSAQLSGIEVDATVATTTTCQLKIMGFAQREDNAIGSADVKVLVKINNHQFANTTVGV
jgi:hypothetical protein